jgi:predicted RNA binding protein YcfA (HicA-like mRNA interferase family)
MSSVPRVGNREIDQLLRSNGWTHERNGKHRIFRCPCGEHSIAVSHAPRSEQVALNNRRRIDQAIRGCEVEVA